MLKINQVSLLKFILTEKSLIINNRKQSIISTKSKVPVTCRYDRMAGVKCQSHQGIASIFNLI